MAAVEAVSERVAKLEGAYEHLATKADIANLKVWLLTTSLGTGIAVAAVVIGALKLLD
jgi:hypothetical protein